MASLNSLTRAQYEDAKRWFRWRFWAHAAALLAAYFATFSPVVVAYIALVSMLVLEIGAWILRYTGQQLKTVADEGRRRTLVVEALGIPEDPLDAANLRSRFSSWAKQNAEKWEDSTYFSGNLPPGVERLQNFLTESAFWSSHLYKQAATQALRFHLVLLSLLLIGLLVAFPLLPDTYSLVFARAFVLMLASLQIADQLQRILDWFVAAKEADQTVNRLSRTEVRSWESTILAFSDYHVATSKVEPIPTKVYTANKDQLNNLWNEFIANKKA